MPGTVAPITGFTDRGLGKTIYPASGLQRVGKGGALAASGGNIFVGASAAGVGNGADITEDTLFSVTLPPGTLDIVGRQILIEAYGSIAASPSATKTAKVYFGSASLTTSFTTTAGGNGIWILTALITKTGPNAQTAMVTVDHTIGGSALRVPVISSPTEADTAGMVVKVTGTSSVATANAVLCNMLSVGGYN